MDRGKLISIKPQAQRPSNLQPKLPLNLQIINPITYPNWDKLVLSHPKNSFFHTANWARILAEAYNYNPVYFLRVEGGRLCDLIPLMDVKSFLTGRRGVSLPFSDYCEPIISCREHFNRIFNEIIVFGKNNGWKFVDLRGGSTFMESIPYSDYYYKHTIEIATNENDIFSKFRKGTKSSIKKGIRDGVKVEICNSLKGVENFYRLNCLTRKKHGLPPQPLSFFKKLYEHAISKNYGSVFIASYNKKNIAAAIFLHFGENVLWKYGASDIGYIALSPNNVVLWEAIRWYSRQGYKSICLGRTDPMNEGLRKFKNGWGANEDVINYYRFSLTKKSFIEKQSAESTWHINIMKKVPVPLLRITGALLYRHMG